MYDGVRVVVSEIESLKAEYSYSEKDDGRVVAFIYIFLLYTYLCSEDDCENHAVLLMPCKCGQSLDVLARH